ncbi:alpha/beta fold hydrolase [Mycolicibacterium vaccae]|uniref:alpha/beta fold hydrolase n=1 Tax=Mycolicibacterium vaccae TaxID=1810 RepID=UPI003CF92E2D
MTAAGGRFILSPGIRDARGMRLGLAHGGFRDAHARDAYLEIYRGLHASGPQPTYVYDIATEFGTNRVYRYGDGRGVSVVLIHGFFLTSAMWWAQIEGLADDFTLYTIDMLGQPGAGVQTKRIATPADAARNIDAVMAELDLRDVHLVGHSYGGWLSTHTAAEAPQRLATLTLVDPAQTVVGLSLRFWRGLALLLTRPHSPAARRAAAWVTGNPTAGSPIAELTNLFTAGFACFAAPLNTPPLRSSGNRLLEAVSIPVQVLLAGTSVHDTVKAIERLTSVVPAWQIEVWPEAGHMLPVQFPDEVNARIRQFVAGHHPR